MSELGNPPENQEDIDNPDSSSTPHDELAEMRAKVAGRRAEEVVVPPADPEPLDDDFIYRCAQNKDIGHGMLYAALNKDRKVYNHQAGCWMIWRGHHWDFDLTEGANIDVEDLVDQYMGLRDRIADQKKRAEEDGANQSHLDFLEGKRETLLKACRYLHSINGVTNCLKGARANREAIAIAGDEIDREPWLLPVANGVLDLRSGLLKPGVPGDYLVLASPVEWRGIDEPCPTWEAALLAIMNDDPEMVAYLRRLFGYAITGQTYEHVFVVLFGDEGRNGKDTMTGTLEKVLGPLVGTVPAEMLLDQKGARSSAGPSPDIMQLRGLRMALASETDKDARFSPSRVKWLSGGGSLTGRYPHDKRLVTFEPTHQLFLLTNEKPYANADDMAFWTRLHLVDFAVRFVKGTPTKPNERPVDLRMKEKLQAEYPGILAWLVRGCLEWQQQGLNPPAKVLEATNEYRSDEDLMQQFFVECLITENVPETDFILSTPLHQFFSVWWEKNINKKPYSQKAFGGRMKKKGYPSEKIPAAGNLMGYRGLRINRAAYKDLTGKEF
jgi:putative DNA primase/helicase